MDQDWRTDKFAGAILVFPLTFISLLLHWILHVSQEKGTWMVIAILMCTIGVMLALRHCVLCYLGSGAERATAAPKTDEIWDMRE
jgi:cobalamin biosynthesis protein CobD/CbiB